MIRRSTWIFLGLFALALAVMWVLQAREDQTVLTSTPTTTPARIFTANSAQPVEIHLTGGQGEVLELIDRGVDGWQIIDPPLGAADASQVNTLITSLLSLQVAAELDPAPSDEAMGMTTPSYTIQLTWMDGQVQVLTVGSQTPTSSRYYARVDGGVAVLISLYSLSEVQNMLTTPPTLAALTPEPTEDATMTSQP